MQANRLREQLKIAEASAGGIGEEKKRLEAELQEAKAAATGVKEEKNRLQNRLVVVMYCYLH